MQPSSSPLVSLEHCFVRVPSGYSLRDINFSLGQSEHWLLCGANGAGKTSFLGLIAGSLHPAQGLHHGHRAKRVWDFGTGPSTSPLDAKQAIALVSPDIQDKNVLSAKKNSAEEIVCTGFFNTAFLWKEPGQAMRQEARAVLGALQAAELAPRHIPELSRGEARLVFIARALAMQPKLLLLDEVLEGLDSSATQKVLTALETVASTGTHIVFSTHYPKERPAFLTHSLTLAQGQVIASTVLEKSTAFAPSFATARDMELQPKAQEEKTGSPLIALNNVTVVREGVQVLKNITWQIYEGEHWALFGANGAGKTTLGSVLTGNIRPSTGLVTWPGLTDTKNIWDIRKSIGVVSAELQAGYSYNVSALALVVSGFFSSIGLYVEPTPQEWQRALECLHFMNMATFRDRPVRSLSYGELRRLMIARALVHKPKLLILDEAVAGLDETGRKLIFEDMLRLDKANVSLIWATHRPEELPPCIGQVLKLEKGAMLS